MRCQNMFSYIVSTFSLLITQQYFFHILQKIRQVQRFELNYDVKERIDVN